MSLLGKLFGNPTSGILDDKAERMFAGRVGAAAIILATLLGTAAVIFAVRCG